MIAEARLQRETIDDGGKRIVMLTRTHVDVANNRYKGGGFALYFVEQDAWYEIHRVPGQNWTICADDLPHPLVMDLGTKRARVAIAKINLLYRTE